MGDASDGENLILIATTMEVSANSDDKSTEQIQRNANDDVFTPKRSLAHSPPEAVVQAVVGLING